MKRRGWWRHRQGKGETCHVLRHDMRPGVRQTRNWFNHWTAVRCRPVILTAKPKAR
jgi:hypothetical protein